MEEYIGKAVIITLSDRSLVKGAVYAVDEASVILILVRFYKNWFVGYILKWTRRKNSMGRIVGKLCLNMVSIRFKVFIALVNFFV